MPNLNDFARDITLEEGLKEQVSVAQVKEIMRLVFKRLHAMTMEEFIKTLNHFRP